MKDQDAGKQQLLEELAEMRRRIAALEAMEEELRRNRAILRATIDSLPFDFFAIGMDGRYLLQNSASKAHWGDAVEKLPEEVAENEENRNLWRENNQRAFAGEHVEKDVTLTVKGEKRYYHNLIVPIIDAGQIQGILGVNIDITERKRAEEALRKAHDQLEQKVQERTAELTKANEELAVFQEFAEASGQGFSMADLDGRITYMNPALARMLGGERPEEFMGSDISAHFSEETNRKGEQEIQPALEQTGHWEGELPILSRHGGEIPTWHNTFMICDEKGSPLCVAVVITDITERKRAEEALRQSEEKHRGLLEACPDAVIMTDLRGKILFASRRTWELVNLSDREELVGKSVYDFVIEEKPGQLAASYSNLIATGVRRNTEYAVLRQDGTTVPTEVSSALNRDAKGQPIAVMGVIRDITERKRAEDKFRKDHRTLKYLLQSSDHERQLIAYEIHDELAQQLAGAMMQFDTYGHLKEKNPKLAAKAYDAGMTMLQQGHFEARRLIAGVRPPILDESGVVAAVGHLVNEQSRLKGPKIEYRSRVDFDRLAPILENAIYRIVQEGLTNACHHSRSEKVRVSLLQHEDRIRIEVRDWGIGFNPKQMKENCYGLVGIRQRVRLLGGKCSIRSKTDQGARVIVELPVVARE